MELIDKETNVWACGLDELTPENIENYFKANKNTPLSDFSFYYEKDKDRIILIKTFELFDIYSIIICDYLGADKARRPYIRRTINIKYDNLMFENSFDFLDKILNRREYIDTVRILKHQSKNIYLNDTNVSYIELKIDNEWVKQYYLFNYGIILGKRMERQKKERHNKQVTACCEVVNRFRKG